MYQCGYCVRVYVEMLALLKYAAWEFKEGEPSFGLLRDFGIVLVFACCGSILDVPKSLLLLGHPGNN